MKRMTISIPDAVMERLNEEARINECSKALIVRSAIKDHLLRVRITLNQIEED